MHDRTDYRHPRGRIMGTRLRITGGVVVALLVVALLASWMVDQAKAKSGGMEAQERPALFVGNESLPPINFIKHGKPSGIVIELAEALAKRMHRPFCA